MVNGRNQPACAVELTEVELKTFDQVDEAHALAEGEGDSTLAYWRKTQQRFSRSMICSPRYDADLYEV